MQNSRHEQNAHSKLRDSHITGKLPSCKVGAMQANTLIVPRCQGKQRRVSQCSRHVYWLDLLLRQQKNAFALDHYRIIISGWFTPNFACGHTLVPDVSSLLLGVSGPRGAEKGGNEMFVTIGVNGEFLHFGGFWAISQQRVDGSTPNFICVGTMSADVPFPPLGSIGPWGEGELKTQKMGGGLIHAVDSYHFYFSQRFQMWFNM